MRKMEAREIKFRGMDANGVMRYGRLSQDKPHSTVYYNDYSQRICWDDSNIPVKNDTLCQYTGLKDKNGREIYEGDIIKVYNASYSTRRIFITVIEDLERAFDREESAVYIGGGYGYISEVIGNIYENPELISK